MNKLSLQHIDGYKILLKEDGTDYTGIWRDFRVKLPAAPPRQIYDNNVKTLKKDAVREVYLLDTRQGRFIMKIDHRVPRHLEMRLWNLLAGPFHSRQMRAINKAVAGGCRVTPEFFLVAEKMRRGLCREAWILQEFCPGPTIAEAGGYAPHLPAIRRAMEELHRYGLAASDINGGNLLLCEDGVKVIDLTWNGTAWAGKAQDLARLKNRCGLELPARGLKLKSALAWILLKHRLRDALHNSRNPRSKENSSI
jgi:heptose II phosphotransferase